MIQNKTYRDYSIELKYINENDNNTMTKIPLRKFENRCDGSKVTSSKELRLFVFK